MKAFGVKDLDTMFRVGCGGVGCCDDTDPTKDRGWVHATCHLQSPPWAYYVRGVLVLECSRCRKTIMAIRAAVDGAEVDLKGV